MGLKGGGTVLIGDRCHHYLGRCLYSTFIISVIVKPSNSNLVFINTTNQLLNARGRDCARSTLIGLFICLTQPKGVWDTRVRLQIHWTIHCKIWKGVPFVSLCEYLCGCFFLLLILRLQLFMPDSLTHLSHVFEKWKAWDFSRDPKSSWKCGGHRFWELTVVTNYPVI